MFLFLLQERLLAKWKIEQAEKRKELIKRNEEKTAQEKIKEKERLVANGGMFEVSDDEDDRAQHLPRGQRGMKPHVPKYS